MYSQNDSACSFEDKKGKNTKQDYEDGANTFSWDEDDYNCV